MKEQAIEQILREAAEGHTAPAPDQLWERLESSLPAASPRSARKLRLYPRSQRYLLPAVAASILVLVVAAWFALGQWASPGAPLAQQHGQLELTEAPLVFSIRPSTKASLLKPTKPEPTLSFMPAFAASRMDAEFAPGDHPLPAPWH